MMTRISKKEKRLTEKKADELNIRIARLLDKKGKITKEDYIDVLLDVLNDDESN